MAAAVTPAGDYSNGFEYPNWDGWNGKMVTGTLPSTSSDATSELWWQGYLPPESEKPVAIAIFAHGIQENSSRYNHLLQGMAKEGNIAAFSMDHVNHGYSYKAGKKRPSGYFSSLENVLDDWAAFFKFAKGYFPGQDLPVYMLGQSFGAMVTILTAMRRDVEPAGVILTAAFINVPRNCFLKALELVAYPATRVVPKARLIAAAAPKLMSNIPKAVKDYVDDPLVNTANIASLPGYLMNNETYWLEKEKGTFSYPLLMFHGTKDACCSYDHAAAFCESVSSSDKEFVPVQDGYHLLWSGPSKESILRKIVQFVHAQAN